MSDIHIDFKVTSHSCEDCGYYESKYLTVKADGKEILKTYEDGHFGNGNDLTDPLQMMKLILEALGHKVEIEENFEHCQI